MTASAAMTDDQRAQTQTTAHSRGQLFHGKKGQLSLASRGVVLGRFFGPLRCIMPLVAGICSMHFIAFQFANVVSAVLWATAVLAPGHFAVGWLLD